MEGILALRESLMRGDISGALLPVEDMAAMGLKAIPSKIRSYSIILLLYLIKQAAQECTTRSWELSIRNAVLGRVIN